MEESNLETKLSDLKITEKVNAKPTKTISSGPQLPRLPKQFLEIIWEDIKSIEVNGKGPYSQSNPFQAKVKQVSLLTTNDAIKRCYHVELDLTNSEIDLIPGDAIGIACSNPRQEVSNTINRLGLKPESSFTLKSTAALPSHLSSHMTVQDVFEKRLELRVAPKKTFIRLLAEYTTNQTEKDRLLFLCSREGSNDYIKTMCTAPPPSLFEILQDFPSCQPPLERLLENMFPLLPRYYSTSCSTLVFPNECHFAFNVIEYVSTKGKPTQGLCSSWLENEICKPIMEGTQKDIQIPIFKKPTLDFKLPEDDNIPIIMVGPGTGVSPFRGFLQHRHHKKNKEGKEIGPSYLFFGCRHEKRDFLYKTEFEELTVSGTLTKLVTAFSRDTEQKVYVQHKLEEHGPMVARLLLEENGHMYLCGDTKGMSKGVHDTLTSILMSHGGLSKEESLKTLDQLMKEKRYIWDIWL